MLSEADPKSSSRAIGTPIAGGVDTEPVAPGAPDIAERIFRATEAEISTQARAVIGGGEPLIAAGAFWPNGATQETVEDGTVAGKKLGAVFGPNLNAMTALAAAFVGRGSGADVAMAKPLIVAVDRDHIYVIEPTIDDVPASVWKTFDRSTTKVRIKWRGMSRIVLIEDDADHHLRLHATVAPYLARSGPQRSVVGALTRRAVSRRASTNALSPGPRSSLRVW